MTKFKKKDSKIPYFIKIRGCINCDASRELKKRTGKEYGFDHELMAKCLIVGCTNFGYSLMNPYYDPEEIARLARKDGRPEIIAASRRLLSQLKKRFGKYYKELKIPIPEL